MRLCMGETVLNNRRAYEHHLKSSRDLVTPHEATRSGFVSLALEKNRKATPLVTEARALKSVASQAIRPRQLLELEFFPARNSLLAAAGVSHKATNHLSDKDKLEAIEGLIDAPPTVRHRTSSLRVARNQRMGYIHPMASKRTLRTVDTLPVSQLCPFPVGVTEGWRDDEG